MILVIPVNFVLLKFRLELKHKNASPGLYLVYTLMNVRAKF